MISCHPLPFIGDKETLPFSLSHNITLAAQETSHHVPLLSRLLHTGNRFVAELQKCGQNFLNCAYIVIKKVEASVDSKLDKRPVQVVTFLPKVDRIIAVGDVHGDLDAIRKVLRLSRVIGSNGEWTGNRTFLVQLGDILDRGDSEREVLKFLEDLDSQASKQGGRVISLLGNHEVMNVDLDFRYVTPGGFHSFTRKTYELEQGYLEKTVPRAYQETIKQLPDFMRPRALALRPGGPTTLRYLSKNPVVLVIGDSVFVHAGLNSSHIYFGLEEINTATRDWLLGKTEKPEILRGRTSPIWTRIYSYPFLPSDAEECLELCSTLDKIPAKRMIVGHTPQAHINAACKGRVWRIDTGLSQAYGGNIEALEITKKGVKVLRLKQKKKKEISSSL
eukprot:jgi/Galph1/6006/GphlegSOOS_G4685.1